MLDQTRDGGFIADLIGSNPASDAIIKRIDTAVEPAYALANTVLPPDDEKLKDQAELRRKAFIAGAQQPTPYADFVQNPDVKQTRAYGDRSIVKEFDQIASAIRARDNDGSYVEIDLFSKNKSAKYTFDDKIARAFHNIVSARSLGDAVEIPITLRGLDSGTNGLSKAVAFNLASKKEFKLYIHTDRGFSSLKGYLKKRSPPHFSIVACPILEYGAFDPHAGDMYFLAIQANHS
ncbi:hypothetical protein [Robbsia andropogonis]|uniref:hypothetical protein n=1 Tax=Robbsia andropogonis TaxID=28092 RepID=UPI00069737A5|nr:hypothetical protein [Robbsia andropogonis]